MHTQAPASRTELIWIGIGLGLTGLACVLIGFELIPVPGGRANLHGPLWLAILIGVILVLAGTSCLVQGAGRADTNARLPDGAPLWMRVTLELIGVALFAAFALLGTWIAVAGESRYFSGGIPLLGGGNISLARIMFGFGALVCWLAAIAYGVQSVRKIIRPAGEQQDP